MLVLRPPAHPPVGRWQGINARIFGRGGGTADVVHWTAFSPAIVDIRASRDGVFGSTLGWLDVHRAVLDSSGFLVVCAADTTAPIECVAEGLGPGPASRPGANPRSFCGFLRGFDLGHFADA